VCQGPGADRFKVPQGVQESLAHDCRQARQDIHCRERDKREESGGHATMVGRLGHGRFRVDVCWRTR
ncbi:unnamed protein product, partial [Ascophyllum nodosum]